MKWRVIPVACNICGSKQHTILWIKDDFQYNRCAECGLVYISPRLTEDEISKIYGSLFKSKSLNKPPPVDFTSYNDFFKLIKKYREKNFLLDVGCFRGYLLSGAREQGWQVKGTELSEQAAACARKDYGLDVHTGSLSDANYPENFFDVVSMFDVIEHLTDPAEYLREIERILRPGGVFYVETPNFNSITRHILGKDWSIFFPWHLYYFTPRTLARLIDKVNLDVMSVSATNWGPISTYNACRDLNSSDSITSGCNYTPKIITDRYKKVLKPYYLSGVRMVNIPLKYLSIVGVNMGAKLIVIAEKSHGRVSS